MPYRTVPGMREKGQTESVRVQLLVSTSVQEIPVLRGVYEGVNCSGWHKAQRGRYELRGRRVAEASGGRTHLRHRVPHNGFEVRAQHRPRMASEAILADWGGIPEEGVALKKIAAKRLKTLN
jgi:hypothetical protein